MIVLAIVFGILAIVLGLFGFRSASRASSNIAWLLAAVFLIVFVVSLIADRA